MSDASMPARGAARDRGHLIGVGVLIALVSSVAVWMQVHGRAVVHASALSRTQPAIGPSRFTGNEWRMPEDAMLGFVAIPPGPFIMGSDPAVDRVAYDNERWSPALRQGEVTLSEFYIGRFEVTVAQFAAFVKDTRRNADGAVLQGMADYPVTNVTWPEAIAYAQWLETQLRNSPQTPSELRALFNEGWHLNLPSEAQWEKAARGSDARVYPWGNSIDPTKANFGRSGRVEVGTFVCEACAFGLADMSGNVWELTRSPFQAYPWTNDEPRDAKADALFVMRGGGFSDNANNVRAAIRGGIDPGARRPFIGFRLVLEKS
jgi:formylglycine-generating enzyme required for sulfatase activity